MPSVAASRDPARLLAPCEPLVDLDDTALSYTSSCWAEGFGPLFHDGLAVGKHPATFIAQCLPQHGATQRG